MTWNNGRRATSAYMLTAKKYMNTNYDKSTERNDRSDEDDVFL